jgi:sec-independent protein translocase protein TatA
MSLGLPELAIILVIVALIFGGKKLPGLGSNIAGFIKGLRTGLKDEDKDAAAEAGENRVIEGETRKED